MSDETKSTVYAHIVLHNSKRQHGEECLHACMKALLAQQGFRIGHSLLITVRENGSDDSGLEYLEQKFPDAFISARNSANLGFAAAHNQGAADFLNSTADYMLVLNPDVRLEPGALAALVKALAYDAETGSACPKLLRADEKLEGISPAVLDAAGMYMTPALRHLDRGSGHPDAPEFAAPRLVFGGSGACLLLKRRFVEDAQLESEDDLAVIDALWPQLAAGRDERAPVFDEAFFAYREDADLAWRAQLLGWRCRYVPTAVGYHRRIVLPERRRALSADVNMHSVRNRFLLQANNYSYRCCPQGLLPGLIVRNLLVLAGVLLREPSSLPGLKQAYLLRHRAAARRRLLYAQAYRRGDPRKTARWFRKRPYTEEPPAPQPEKEKVVDITTRGATHG